MTYLSICISHTSNGLIMFAVIMYIIVLIYSLLNLFGYWTLNIYYIIIIIIVLIIIALFFYTHKRPISTFFI